MTALQGVGTSFSARYEQLIGEKCGLPAKWCLPPTEKKQPVEPPPASSGSGADNVRMASIAQFDADGKLIVRTEEKQPITIPVIDWKKWQSDREVNDRVGKHHARTVAYSACAKVWFGAPEVNNIEVVKPSEIGKEKNKRWLVKALEDFEPEKLLMVPYISGPERLLDKTSIHPEAIVVTVQSGDDMKTFAVMPDFSTKTEAQVAEVIGDKAYAANSRSIFWACKRSSKEEECNCEIVDMKTSVTACTQWNSVSGMGLNPSATASVVTVPVLVNRRKIPKGDEVVVKVAPPPVKAKQPKKNDSRTWEHDAKSLMAPPKKPKVH